MFRLITETAHTETKDDVAIWISIQSSLLNFDAEHSK